MKSDSWCDWLRIESRWTGFLCTHNRTGYWRYRGNDSEIVAWNKNSSWSWSNGWRQTGRSVDGFCCRTIWRSRCNNHYWTGLILQMWILSSSIRLKISIEWFASDERKGRKIEQKGVLLSSAPPPTVLTNEARQRLRAIEEFSDLGSGFHVANARPDIRGAGNLLGGEQSGFISEIGFEMYHKILDEALQELQGKWIFWIVSGGSKSKKNLLPIVRLIPTLKSYCLLISWIV